MAFLVLGFMALCAALLIARPFLMPVNAGPALAGDEALRIDLAAIDEALARGDLDNEAASAARVDAERRFLKTGAAVAPAPAEKADKRAAAIVAAFLLVGAGGLYAITRNPDTPTAAEQAPPTPESQLSALIAQLEEKLKADPTNPEGWRALGWAYFIEGDYPKSGAAYQKAIAIAPDVAPYRSGYGETLVGAGEGVVTLEAAAAFSEALRLDKADVRARFYLGLAKAQKGNPNAAIEDWYKLYQEAPAGSDAAGELRKRIEELAAENKIDVSSRFVERGPTSQDVQAAGEMTAQERDAMIDAMVTNLENRLRQNPNDLEGWVRLIHARGVQGKAAEASAALARARAAFSGDAGAQRALDQAGLEAGVP